VITSSLNVSYSEHHALSQTASGLIVHDVYFVPFCNEIIAKMGANKARAASHKYMHRAPIIRGLPLVFDTLYFEYYAATWKAARAAPGTKILA